MNDCTLNMIQIGKYGIIKMINTADSIKRRLLDIGLIPKTKVKSVLESPGGDIKAYMIRGSLIAIRNADASKIVVDKCD